MTRRLAGMYALASTLVAVLVVGLVSTAFGFGAPPADAFAAEEPTAAQTVVDVAPAYSSALGELEAMRTAALNEVTAQVAAQRAVLQEQAVREVEDQRAALQAQALNEVATERAAAQQALAADIAAGRAQVQGAQAPVPTAVPPRTTSATGSVATPSPAGTPLPLTSEAQNEITKKTTECERKRGDDRSECLRELTKLRARYGL